MDRIEQLGIFIRVAHSGGFTAAAQQLDLPRPTVSLAIQQLEKRLGTRLFNRTTRRVSLTQDGERLLERALNLVADNDALEQQFQPQASALSGRIRTDMPSRIARCLVAPALPAFLESHPDVAIELGSSDRAIDLVRDGIDCALRVGDVRSESLVAHRLGHLRMANCASPAYLARFGTPQSPMDLPQHRMVGYALASKGGGALWEWQAGEQTGEQVRTITMPSPVSVNNVETYIACGLAGTGLIQIPAYDVHAHLQQGELVEVMAQWPAPPMPVHLVYPHRRNLSPRVKAFSRWLEALLAPYLS